VERETFVAEAEVHAELRSTNDRALRLAETATRLPRLIAALRQTAGRGRGANRWWAGDGALTFSLLLDAPPVPLERWPQMSLAVGGAVCMAVAGLVPNADVRLKWPNDVFVNGRKACGILVEVPPQHGPRRTDFQSVRAPHDANSHAAGATFQTTTSQPVSHETRPQSQSSVDAPGRTEWQSVLRPPGRIVIGIGLNVNNSLAAAPPDVRARATSLRDLVGAALDLTDVLVALLRRIERDLSALAAADPGLPDRWRRLCYLTGRSVAVNDGARSIAGTCLGVDDDGALRLQTEAGPRRFFGGVVELFE
jgi:BirA family biotin operon repressor/biotin-[acetyl-CoA-carboxylase] ligase